MEKVHCLKRFVFLVMALFVKYCIWKKKKFIKGCII